jgi:hypothetical protein
MSRGEAEVLPSPTSILSEKGADYGDGEEDAEEEEEDPGVLPANLRQPHSLLVTNRLI